MPPHYFHKYAIMLDLNVLLFTQYKHWLWYSSQDNNMDGHIIHLDQVFTDSSYHVKVNFGWILIWTSPFTFTANWRQMSVRIFLFQLHAHYTIYNTYKQLTNHIVVHDLHGSDVESPMRIHQLIAYAIVWSVCSRNLCSMT